MTIPPVIEYVGHFWLKASSTIIRFNLGKFSRRAGNKRLLAGQEQSFLFSPSWRVIASVHPGNTLGLLG